MVGPEKITIGNQIFIFLQPVEINKDNRINWMFSINGAGICGRAPNEKEALNDILKISKLSDDLIDKIKSCRNKKQPDLKIENVGKLKINNYIQMDLFG